MKNIWRPENIVAGLLIIRESSSKHPTKPSGVAVPVDLGFARTVTYKIGWTHSKEEPYGLISVLTDGMYIPIGTKEQMCEHFNNDEYGYRPLTKEEMFKMLESSDQGFY